MSDDVVLEVTATPEMPDGSDSLDWLICLEASKMAPAPDVVRILDESGALIREIRKRTG